MSKVKSGDQILIFKYELILYLMSSGVDFKWIAHWSFGQSKTVALKDFVGTEDVGEALCHTKHPPRRSSM